ncbi:MAG: hypothetical protein VW907_00250, partial [Opitutae bacterium]
GDPNDVQIDFENDQIILKTGGAPRVNITNTEVSSSGISRIITLSASADVYVSGAVSASVLYGVGTGITGIPSTGITPAGSDNEIQFNNGGVMGASANLTWTDTHLFVSGTTVLSGTLLTHDILPIIDEQYSIGIDTLRYENAYFNYMNGGVAFDAVNDEGVAITKGQVVYIKGISGGTPTVALAACDVPAKMPAFGFVADGTINQGAQGRIVTMGRLNGIDTSTFSEGNILYVQTGSNGTSGSFTATRPTGSNNLLQNIGKVTEAAASGQIRAGGAGRTNATPNLDKGYLFVGNDSDCSVQDNTIYVSSSANRVGINTIPLDSTLEVNGTTAVSGNVNIRLNNQFFQGYSTANANVSLIGVYSDDVIHVGNLGYDISLRDDTFVQGNISGSGTAQFVGATILGNDLSVSGSTIMESLTANGITNVGAYSGSSTLHVDGNATIGSDVLASGSISASVGLSAGTFISSSLGIHVTGSQPHIAIGDKFAYDALSGMLSIRPSDTSNKTLALMQAADADGGRIALGVSGSGQITVGGGAFDGVLNVSGSDIEKLIHAQSDSHNPVFQVSGSGEVIIGSNTPTLIFNDGATAAASIGLNTGDNVIIENLVLNKSIVFKTNDGGVSKEAIRITGLSTLPDSVSPEVVINEGSDSLMDFRVESDNNTHMLYVSGSNDRVAIGASDPEVTLDVNGNAVRIRTSSTPSSASDVGVAGEIRWDANYIYVCVATDTWKRVAISTW